MLNFGPSIDEIFRAAVAHHAAGRFEQAEIGYQHVLAAKPDHDGAIANLGVMAAQTNQHQRAVELLSRAIELNPASAASHSNIACSLKEIGRYDDAVRACRNAIALAPGFVDPYVNLGDVLVHLGKFDEAAQSCRRAIELNPASDSAFVNLAMALSAGKHDEAIAASCRALELSPGNPLALNILGASKMKLGHFDQALACFREAFDRRPQLLEACNNLGYLLLELGHVDEAIAVYRRGLALAPRSTRTANNLLLTLLYQTSFDPRAVADEHRRIVASVFPNIPPAPHDNTRERNRALRIGYLSPDFRDHPVGRFIAPLLREHDKSRFEIFLYSCAPVSAADELSARLKTYASTSRDIVDVSDADAARQIRADRIDVLVDLAGHSADNRLPIFAFKPAPVQVSYLGYPATTGLEQIDYRLTDAATDPPNVTDSLHTEKLERISLAWCFEPMLDAPQPARSAGPITFGCFNKFTKINEALLRIWGRILKQVPDSMLALKGHAMSDAGARRRVCEQLSAEGISADRVKFLPWINSYRDHLAAYENIDIALDTFPYNGTTNTCEAFWMGVPVVTLVGESHVSRVGVSLLGALHLQSLIARSPDEYISIATALAVDAPRRTQMRQTLRQTMLNSPLMDARNFANNIEAAYRRMWHRYCDAPV